MDRWLVLAFLVGCGGGLADERFPTGSTTTVATARYDAVAAVNVDEDSVSFVDAETGAVEELPVGLEPTRIARVGDQLWVTLRGERAVAVLTSTGDGWAVDGKIAVGAEPYGIVATEDGKRVYVAVSLADRVVEIDARSREIERRFDVPDEPRWLALHPSGRALFVASHRGGTLSRIDLEEGTVAPIELPGTIRRTEDADVDLTPRLTGDLAITPDGGELAAPTLYVDITTSVDSGEDPTDPPSSNGYGSSGEGVGRTNPALVTVALDRDGRPDGEASAIFLATSIVRPGGGDERFQALRSYPTSATAAPNGDEYVVTMEASDAVLLVRRAPFKGGARALQGDVDVAFTGDTAGGPSLPFTSPEAGGFVVRPISAAATVGGPRGVAFLDDEDARVHGFLDRTLVDGRFAALHDHAREAGEEGFASTSKLATPLEGPALAQSALPADVEAGRRLFYSAVDSRMAGVGGGISCSTCHLDGREDGLTWTLNGAPRQTPSLAGPVDRTAPVTWAEEVPSVADEAILTTSLRMGGEGLSPDDAALVEAFIVSTRYPETEDRDRDDDLVRLGREVFERAEVGCATCHAGELYTDNQSHLVLGDLPTQTPTLRGIAASAPYMHDGSAPTLRAVLALGANGVMGDTRGLTERELEALEAFLRTL